MIFLTVPHYNDRCSAAAVERAIQLGVKKSSVFLKTFTGSLVQYCSKLSKGEAIAVKHKLIRWTVLLLEANPDVFQSKAAFSRLFAAQSSLLTSVLKNGRFRLRVRVLNFFTSFLEKVTRA